MKHLTQKISKVISTIFPEITENSLLFQPTRKEFEGELTIVIFPLVKQLKKSPNEIANQLGEAIVGKVKEVKSFQLVSGFLNISFTNKYWLQQFSEINNQTNWGIAKPSSSGRTILVEYSSPNTNKPLHLGHLRNNFLGYSVAEILKAVGHKVFKVQVINDRGIHICKSMVAWQKMANGSTPQTENIKGDKFVGNYYVAYDAQFKKEVAELMDTGVSKEEAEKKAPIFLEAQQMLRNWEQGKPDTLDLWKKMNGWVYQGFNQTYQTMEVNFDKLYYESETFLEGKELVKKGLNEGIFYQKNDGSIWVDLTDEGLDEKLLIRADGTSVYITQDIGTAILRKTDFPEMDQLIYTVGNEQDYHFKVLFLVLQKLGYQFAKNCFHLSYGMVDLPSGKMKSREGTVVDADDLMEEMFNEAEKITTELGKLEEATPIEKQSLYRKIGLAALKYFILKVDPKKRMVFNPNESIDFTGNTGPFIQYTHARISAILRRAGSTTLTQMPNEITHHERELIKLLSQYPEVISQAAQNYNPAIIANYTYELVKSYNHFYQTTPIFNNNQITQSFRVNLSAKVAEVIKSAMQMLGIQVPDRM